MKKMKSMSQVKREYPGLHIEDMRCPDCGGILVTEYGPISITVCVEDGCLYSDYDYDLGYEF